MPRVLDIVPLRSLIAVADAGGFHRAAADLQLSQSAVSQHIRRLEKALGRPLVEPDGRRARLTKAGVALLSEARRIVAAHDEALLRLGPAEGAEFIIGTTDHGADHILPPIVTELGLTSPALNVKFRFDRTTPLNEAVDRGSVDLAVFITEASARLGTLVGSLPLVWCAASTWDSAARGAPWPLIAIEAPCAIRGRPSPSSTSTASPRPWSARWPRSAGCSTPPGPGSASACWRWPGRRPRAWSRCATSRLPSRSA